MQIFKSLGRASAQMWVMHQPGLRVQGSKFGVWDWECVGVGNHKRKLQSPKLVSDATEGSSCFASAIGRIALCTGHEV